VTPILAIELGNTLITNTQCDGSLIRSTIGEQKSPSFS